MTGNRGRKKTLGRVLQTRGAVPGRPWTVLSGLILLALSITGGWVSPTPAQAQGLRSFSIAAENDGLAFWTPPHDRSDWYYTHGMRIEGTFAWAVPGSGLLGKDVPPPCGPTPSTEACSLTRFSLGQAIYTPHQLFTEPPPPADHPYGGWLYLEASALRLDGRRGRRVGLDLGVTGDPSLAGPVHRWFHRALGKHEPMGWDSQIPFELAFSATFENREAFTLSEGADGLVLRFEHRGLLQAGTLRTGAMGGISIQTGWHAPRFLDWAGIRPERGYLSLVVGADGELVLRDLFLDGSTFGDGPQVERVPLVGHLRATLQVGTPGFALEFSGSRRTTQFTGQREPHSTGLIRIIIRP